MSKGPVSNTVHAMLMAERSEGVTTAQLAKRCGIRQSSAYRLLTTLEQLGVLVGDWGAVPKVQSPGGVPLVFKRKR